MKSKYFVILAVCFSVSLAFLIAGQEVNPQRKGIIDEQNGVRIIKIPNEPLYGKVH
jgi:hypothetical protein